MSVADISNHELAPILRGIGESQERAVATFAEDGSCIEYLTEAAKRLHARGHGAALGLTSQQMPSCDLMSEPTDITQVIATAMDGANKSGAIYGFEMCRLAVIALLYDEAAAGGRTSLAAVADLVVKVKALQLPQ